MKIIHILDKLDSANDLGVIFDSNLSFRDHISHKINKAYSILGIIKRNFYLHGPHKFPFAIQIYGSPALRVCKFCLVPLSEKRYNRD